MNLYGVCSDGHRHCERSEVHQKSGGSANGLWRTISVLRLLRQLSSRCPAMTGVSLVSHNPYRRAGFNLPSGEHCAAHIKMCATNWGLTSHYPLFPCDSAGFSSVINASSNVVLSSASSRSGQFFFLTSLSTASNTGFPE
jgi:hypothetical protein